MQALKVSLIAMSNLSDAIEFAWVNKAALCGNKLRIANQHMNVVKSTINKYS